jgi:hypothetical protein
LGREGTLWTFALPVGKARAEVATLLPVSAIQTANQWSSPADLVSFDDLLIVGSGERCFELLDLADPAHPRSLGHFGPVLGACSGQFLLLGRRLLQFGGIHESGQSPKGYLVEFDLSEPRQPRLVGLSRYSNEVTAACVLKDDLWIAQKTKRGAYTLARLSAAAPTEGRPTDEQPCPNGCSHLVPWNKGVIGVGDAGVYFLATAQSTTRAAPLLLPGGSRSAVLFERHGSPHLALDSAMWRYDGTQWSLLGTLPSAGGSGYRAVFQNPHLAIPGGDRVWLYAWEDQ